MYVQTLLGLHNTVHTNVGDSTTQPRLPTRVSSSATQIMPKYYNSLVGCTINKAQASAAKSKLLSISRNRLHPVSFSHAPAP